MKIETPEFITVPKYIPPKKVAMTLHLAKQGEKDSIKQLSGGAPTRIWTYSQLDALNTFRMKREKLLTMKGYPLDIVANLLLDFDKQVTFATSEWYKPMTKTLMLVKLHTVEKGVRYIIFYTSEKAGLQQLCDVTRWYTQE